MTDEIDGKSSGEKVVYVREVLARDLPSDVILPPGVTKVYAIHDETGARLALTGDRNMAFQVARQHDLAPVSVH